MTIQDWGAIGEIVGAAGVIVSLIYLALQIRQSNLESQSSTLHQYLATQANANNSISNNPEIAALIVRAEKDFASLSEEEILRLQFVFYNHFKQWLYTFQT